MADAPQPRPTRDVIPLRPGRAADPALPRWTAALLAAMPRVRVPAELAALVRVNARGALEFLAPALFLALGVALLALLAGSVAAALGVKGVSAGAVATTQGGGRCLPAPAARWRGAGSPSPARGGADGRTTRWAPGRLRL